MRLLFLTVTLLACTVPFMASAMSLTEAKSQGLVGEQTDGYLGVVKPGAEDVVESVNAARRAEYESIAAGKNTSREVVEQLAAKQAYEKTLPGNYVQKPDGSWRKK